MLTAFKTTTENNQTRNSKSLGQIGENLTAQWLKKQGFTILKRNYKKRFGEIDLIARKKDLLIFVEVKCRRKHYFPLCNVIVPAKQQKIIKTASNFLEQYEQPDSIFRFDVALIESGKHGLELNYIPNAFTADIIGW